MGAARALERSSVVLLGDDCGDIEKGAKVVKAAGICCNYGFQKHSLIEINPPPENSSPQQKVKEEI